jgi:pimeloyl-ACP methyl ester carboxylesterase
MRRTPLVSAAILSLLVGSPASADVLDRTATFNGLTVHYKVIRPRNFDPAKAYPAILAFPPGSQDMDMVQIGIDYNYRAEAERRGYLVFEPAAPNGLLFFEGGDRIFPAFVTKLLGDYRILDGKFHVAGNSNGGLSAFEVAADYPQYFWSVTGFPGFLDAATPEELDALGKMCVHMFVGERDSGWLEASRDQAATLRAHGASVTFDIEKGESHVLGTLVYEGAARLFDQFDAARRGRCAR